MYNVVHMGPNQVLGGVQAGLVRATYQVVSSGVVTSDPSNPTSSTITMEDTNLPISFDILFFKKFNLRLFSFF